MTSLLGPISALALVTGVVWLTMVIARTTALRRGIASMRYYRAYTASVPPEWVERPARAFANLFEVPVLFYLVCLLMLQTGTADSTQVALAWLFVAARATQAAIHIIINRIQYRFAAYAVGCATVIALWIRFLVARG
jgi:hypothetical protein